MRIFRYDDENYQVAETVEEFLDLLKEGDVITSNYPFEGDENAYYCGSVACYTYGSDVNAEGVEYAISSLPSSLELDVWRDDEGIRFFYNADKSDLTWHFEY